MVSALLFVCVCLSLVVCCACRQQKVASRLARIERLKTLTEKLDAHGVNTTSQRVKLV